MNNNWMFCLFIAVVLVLMSALGGCVYNYNIDNVGGCVVLDANDEPDQFNEACYVESSTDLDNTDEGFSPTLPIGGGNESETSDFDIDQDVEHGERG